MITPPFRKLGVPSKRFPPPHIHHIRGGFIALLGDPDFTPLQYYGGGLDSPGVPKESKTKIFGIRKGIHLGQDPMQGKGIWNFFAFITSGGIPH